MARLRCEALLGWAECNETEQVATLILSVDRHSPPLEDCYTGGLIIISPTEGGTGYRKLDIAYQLQGWSRQSNLGVAFDSSTGFKLPNNTNLSPDASWGRREKIDALTTE